MAKASDLAALLGLDEESVASQVMPYLATLTTPLEVQQHLQGMLGPGEASKAFIREYTHSRFGKPFGPTPKAASAQQPRPPQPKQSKPAPASRSAATSAKSTPRASTSNTPNRVPTPTAPAVHEFSDAVAEELASIERQMKLLTVRRREGAGCFCKARLHELSKYSPSCPACGLVLCTANSPLSPCPSCGKSGLVSSSILEQHLVAARTRKEEVLAQETRRQAKQREEEERVRRAIKFPELGQGVAQPLQHGKSWNQAAGGGQTIADHIDQMYERQQVAVPSGPVKVLRLDTKTHKAKIQTTERKKRASPAAASGGNALVDGVASLELDEPDDHTGPPRWTDESDDLWRERRGLPVILGGVVGVPA